MRVFLSHSSADKYLARRLAHDLKAVNIDVWLDQWEIQVGEAFAQRIEQGLDNVDFVIVLLTVSSVMSEWVDREWRHRVEQEAKTKNVTIVPVLGEPCEIPDFLAQRSQADVSAGSYPLGFKHLLTLLRHHSAAAIVDGSDRPTSRPIRSPAALPLQTPISLEVSADLIPLFQRGPDGTNRALEVLAPRTRDALETEFGFTFPGVRVLGNDPDMPLSSALISLEEIPELYFGVGPEEVVVAATVDELRACGIASEERDDPAMGRALTRVSRASRSAAEAAGFATRDAAEYLFETLHSVVRRSASLFLDVDITWGLVNSVAREAPDLVAITVPSLVSWVELTAVLQRLVDEEICIADMRSILEALAQSGRDTKDPDYLAEQARHALRSQITARYAPNRRTITAFGLDAELEPMLIGGIRRTASGSYLQVAPDVTKDLLSELREQMRSLGPRAAGIALLVTSPDIRPFVRRLVGLEFPSLHVLSRHDLDPDIEVRIVAVVGVPSGRELLTDDSPGAPK